MRAANLNGYCLDVWDLCGFLICSYHFEVFLGLVETALLFYHAELYSISLIASLNHQSVTE